MVTITPRQLEPRTTAENAVLKLARYGASAVTVWATWKAQESICDEKASYTKRALKTFGWSSLTLLTILAAINPNR